MRAIRPVNVKSAVALGAPPNARRIIAVSVFARAVTSKIASVWARLSLSQKFCAAASVVVACGMVLIASWVAGRIEAVVVQNSATTTALYMDNFISPHVQELASASEISDEHKRALDVLLSPQAIPKPIVSFKIWKGNTVVYSDRKEYIGKTFPPSDAFKRAWTGQVAGSLDYLSEEHSPEHGHLSPGLPILEIYIPVREQDSHRIIALAETYESAPELKNEVSRARFQSWLLVGAVASAIVASLFALVHNDGRTIALQGIALKTRIAELSRLLTENNELRIHVSQANERVAESNERFLRSIRAELHDGPMQLLGLALLRLDGVGGVITKTTGEIPEKTNEVEMIRSVLAEAMQDIRHISAGLGPPDIENISLREVLQMVAHKHEQRTGTDVRCEFERLDGHVAFPLKACLYRFAQEGLNNAYQHAAGQGQALLASCDGTKVEVKVIDEGPGMAGSKGTDNGGGQGLNGLHDRIESLGGTFEVHSRAGRGTCLIARFGMSPEQIGSKG